MEILDGRGKETLGTNYRDKTLTIVFWNYLGLQKRGYKRLR